MYPSIGNIQESGNNIALTKTSRSPFKLAYIQKLKNVETSVFSFIGIIMHIKKMFFGKKCITLRLKPAF